VETHLTGESYDFRVYLKEESDDNSNCSLFSILAIHRATGRCSSINNLNSILSELGVDSCQSKYEDSFWLLNKREGLKLYKFALNILKNKYLTYVEGILDEDRASGDWEGIYDNGIVICD